MTKDSQPSRFKALLDKRKQVDAAAERMEETVADVERGTAERQGSETAPLRRMGRPRGRRSDPDYTQISAYIPLDLLLEIQAELAQEKRRLRQRSAATVSELAETLLREWLNQRTSD
jgi:hypothetical protein